MAKKPTFNTPPQPKKLGYWANRSIMRKGRKDAKTTQGLKDFSRTQAINVFEAVSHKGEYDLADWLLRVTAPYVAGNARIKSEAGLQCTRIKKAKSVNATSGREKKYAAIRLAVLEQEMSDLRAQFDANKEVCRAFMRRAEEAQPLWENLFRQKAATYYRARSGKAKVAIDATSSELPPYHVRELPDLPSVDEDFPFKEGDC